MQRGRFTLGPFIYYVSILGSEKMGNATRLLFLGIIHILRKHFPEKLGFAMQPLFSGTIHILRKHFPGKLGNATGLLFSGTILILLRSSRSPTFLVFLSLDQSSRKFEDYKRRDMGTAMSSQIPEEHFSDLL